MNSLMIVKPVVREVKSEMNDERSKKGANFEFEVGRSLFCVTNCYKPTFHFALLGCIVVRSSIGIS
jgi:hypothetical protein